MRISKTTLALTFYIGLMVALAVALFAQSAAAWEIGSTAYIQSWCNADEADNANPGPDFSAIRSAMFNEDWALYTTTMSKRGTTCFDTRMLDGRSIEVIVVSTYERVENIPGFGCLQFLRVQDSVAKRQGHELIIFSWAMCDGKVPDNPTGSGERA